MNTNDIAKKIKAMVIQEKDKILADLVTCIQFDTANPPGNEKPLAEFIAQEMRDVGANVEFEEVFTGRPNVLSSLKFSEGSCFLLNSHMDTVPIGNEQWEYDPLQGKVDEEFIYGRGACDAKGSLVAMMAAVKILAKLELPLRGELFFTPVALEETGGSGTDYFVKKGMAGRKPTAAVVGEPTNCQIAIGHRGSNRRKIIIKGVATHSSNPDKGENAIYRASRFALAIEELHENLRSKYVPYFGSPVVSTNLMSGGVEHAIIPDQAEIVVDRRRVPGEGKLQLDQEIEKLVKRMRQTDPSLEYEIIDIGMDKEPAVTDESEEVVVNAKQTVYELTGEEATLTGLKAGTDMTFIKNEGNVPTVIYGPGDMNNAHSVNEYVPINEVLEAVSFYALLATKVLR